MTKTPMPNTERQAIMSRLRAKHVKTERDDTLRELLDELVECQESPDRIDGQGLVIVGESGAGKTTTLEHHFRTHPAFRGYGTRDSQLVTLTLPSPCRLIQLGRMGCERLGYPLKGEKTLHRTFELFREHLDTSNTNYLHCDEMQNVLKNANVIEAENIRNTLKSFLNNRDRRTCLILSGLPAVADFVKADPQISRRCSFLRLESIGPDEAPFIYDIATSYAAEAGLAIEPHEDAALGLRLLHAGCYQLGRAIQYTLWAIDLALKTGEDTLTRFVYAAYYGRRNDCGPAANPFLADNYLEVDCHDVMRDDTTPSASPEKGEPAPEAPRQKRERAEKQRRNGRGW